MPKLMRSMKKRDAVAQGWFDAHWFLKDFHVSTRADIQPEKWSYAMEIEIVEDDLDGAAAQLIRLPQLVQIVLPTRITEYCARRFAIVHELYHFIQRHPSLSPTMMCKPKSMRGGKQHRFEIGANAFAGAVLLPEFLVRKRCEISPVSLDVPRQLEREFDVSILTATIRFCELSPERCCAVFSRNGVVEWVAPSPTWTRTIPVGQPVHEDTVAWDFFRHGSLEEGPQLVPGCSWFKAPRGVDIVEHAVCRADYGTVLSLLWVPELAAGELGMP